MPVPRLVLAQRRFPLQSSIPEGCDVVVVRCVVFVVVQIPVVVVFERVIGCVVVVVVVRWLSYSVRGFQFAMIN